MAKESAKRGRPSSHTPQLADEICHRLAEGESLKSICREKGMPNYSTVMDWAKTDREGFRRQYDEARRIGMDVMFDELLDIADGHDGSEWGRDRLRVDTRKWYLSKLAPKRFGNKLEVEQHTSLQDCSDEELEEAILKKMKLLKADNPRLGRKMLEILQSE